jgi:hypothetical protein
MKRVSCTLSWMQLFPSPFNSFLLYLISFSFKRIVGGHFPGVVTSGDNVTHKHFTNMRRLARDETPFSWLCHQETLPWHGDQMNISVILLHAHGPNRLARDETPIHQLSLEFYLFMGPSFFLLRSLLFLSRRSLGESYQGLIFCILTFSNYFYPLGLYPLLPTRQGTTLYYPGKPNAQTNVGDR